MSKVTEFTIVRSKWLNGGQAEDSMLLDHYDRQCCLGFYGSACGLVKEELLEVAFPSEVNPSLPEEMSWLLKPFPPESVFISNCQDKLVDINDKKGLSQGEREEGIAHEFAKQGITVNFI